MSIRSAVAFLSFRAGRPRWSSLASYRQPDDARRRRPLSVGFAAAVAVDLQLARAVVPRSSMSPLLVPARRRQQHVLPRGRRPVVVVEAGGRVQQTEHHDARQPHRHCTVMQPTRHITRRTTT